MVKIRKKIKYGGKTDDRREHKRRNWGPLFRVLLPIGVFVWPVLYLFNHVFPIAGMYTAIGNDFEKLYFRYKLYLLSHLVQWRFPFWAAGEGAGFPFYTNPFAQALYPLNFLLAVWFKLASGYSIPDHQAYTVLGISIFAVGLYMWLRLLNTNTRAVLFSVLVMSVSFKVTEITRFPNAVHTAAWYPWILYSLTRIFFSPSIRRSVIHGLLLVFFMTCFFTAGYPYYIYYSLFLFGPYFLAMLIKPFRISLFGQMRPRYALAFTTLAAAALLTGIICGPYLFGQASLMSQTVDRSGGSYEYSTKHLFNTWDTIGSLVYPPSSQAEGWYFFSITAVILIVLYLCRPVPAGSQLTDTDPLYEKKGFYQKSFLVLWFLLVSYITYGRDSILFTALWKYLPGFSSLRVWGRCNIVLVPILAWLLSLAYDSFESALTSAPAKSDRPLKWFKRPLVILIICYAIIALIQLRFHFNADYDRQWIIHFAYLSDRAILFLYGGFAAFIVIMLLLVLRRYLQPRWNAVTAAVVFAALFITAALEMHPVGAKMWLHEGCVRRYSGRYGWNIDKLYSIGFALPRTDRKNTMPTGPNFSVGILPNWYFDRYVKFLEDTKDELDARKILLGVRDGQRVFFSESIKHDSVTSFLADAMRYNPPGHLQSYVPEELRWQIQAPTDGYLSFIDNWDPDWRASVDSEPAPIELLFGTFKSVRIGAGRHQVRFYYRPRFYIGSPKEPCK